MTKEIETRSQAAAELLAARIEQLSDAIKSNTGEAAQALEQLTTSTTETINTRVEQLSTADQDQHRRRRALDRQPRRTRLPRR